MSAFVGEVHPLADVFPLLDEESLEALADDIAGHGLRQPIVVDKRGRLLDGRNRLTACRMARVSPMYVTPPGLDTEEQVAAFIVSANLQRRDLTQGQKAHLAVRLLTQIVSTRETAVVAGVPQQRINEARQVAEHAPHLVDEVIAGTLPHSTAYAAALTAKQGTTPTPAPTRRRKPLTDQARTASYDLLKAAERLQRLTSDDRWARNAEQVREAISSDLRRAIEALTTALQELQPEGTLP